MRTQAIGSSAVRIVGLVVPTAPATPHTWGSIRRLIGAWWRDRSQFSRKRFRRTCPICGYQGIFISVGVPSRWDARCARCGSRERHRLTHLWVTEGGGNKLAGKRILHFAPEKVVTRMMRGNPLYETADLRQKGVTHRVDITRLPLPDASYDAVIAHHVLEHISDDRKAMREVFRLLAPGGFAILSVPINASRHATYENPAVKTPEERFAHFSGEDHLRYYGLDFADRLAGEGFLVETFRLPAEQEVTYGLLRNEWITVAWKPLTDAA
jgi:SAM-dependent methyltransferase